MVGGGVLSGLDSVPGVDGACARGGAAGSTSGGDAGSALISLDGSGVTICRGFVLWAGTGLGFGAGFVFLAGVSGLGGSATIAGFFASGTVVFATGAVDFVCGWVMRKCKGGVTGAVISRCDHATRNAVTTRPWTSRESAVAASSFFMLAAGALELSRRGSIVSQVSSLTAPSGRVCLPRSCCLQPS